MRGLVVLLVLVLDLCAPCLRLVDDFVFDWLWFQVSQTHAFLVEPLKFIRARTIAYCEYQKGFDHLVARGMFHHRKFIHTFKYPCG
jgi:hypothetical protein